ncbi:MAG: VOC family protein [Hamadaea sp.]|uniref:VOC family protein n=1 Tax=Hamadaea sp. TaxID=2024425 RepID=UPI001816EE10|nr:VOC family protein [Hamadaea sp.]NUR47468.1 VOC family protein [Hamadaea sp.]NUT18869.1 VOC family protein [Hamadaea sp.]
MAHPVVHWEIGTDDAAAAREFYAKAFGWTMTDAGPEYTMVPAAENGLGGGIMQTRAGMPSYVTIYTQVDDLDAKLAEISELGGHTIVTPTEINPTASFAMFADPSGNVLGLLRATGPIAG